MPTHPQTQPPLPLSRALSIAWRSLRVRLTRSLLTLVTIAMAIAFVTNTALNRLLPGIAAADNHALARTVWLLTLSLLVSAVGITNAMLMSVMERFREIGTMKCLGALDSFILQLFLCESLLLGAAGSLAGVLLGYLLTLAQCIARQKTAAWLAAFHTQGLAIAAAALLLLGLLLTAAAAAYPSWKAARMPPIEALRVDV